MGQCNCCCWSGKTHKLLPADRDRDSRMTAELEMGSQKSLGGRVLKRTLPQRPVVECRRAGGELYQNIVSLIKDGRDSHCRALGSRWIRLSGVAEKLDSLFVGHSYATYIAEMKKLPPHCKKEDTILGEAIRVIERDVPRTIPPSWKFEKTQHILETAFHEEKDDKIPYAEMQQSLQRVLTAFVIRNRTLGYCQGLNSIAAVLLSVLEESDAFWVLCIICEDLRPRDYYASGSNSMGGLHIDAAIALRLIRKTSERLAKALDSDFILLVNMSMFHWVETIFVTEVEFDSACIILDLFLQFGDAFLLSLLIEIYHRSEAEICKHKNSQDFLDIARRVIEGQLRSLDPKTLLKIVKKMKYLVSRAELKKLRCEERESAAEAWKETHKRKQLTKYTNFTDVELETLQREAGLEEKGGLVGLNKDQFNRFLSPTGAVAQRDFTDAIFELFDENCSGFIDFRELAICLSIFSKGTRDEKIRTLFSYYDMDKSGFLSYNEVVRMAYHLEALVRFLHLEKGVQKLRRSTVDELRRDTAEARSDRLFSYLNLANDQGLVSYSEFVARLRVDQDLVDLFTLDLSVRLTTETAEDPVKISS